VAKGAAIAEPSPFMDTPLCGYATRSIAAQISLPLLSQRLHYGSFLARQAPSLLRAPSAVREQHGLELVVLPRAPAELHRAGLGFSRRALQQRGQLFRGAGLSQGEGLLHIFRLAVFEDDRRLGPTNFNSCFSSSFNCLAASADLGD
jgi:hypothetical protein